MIIFAIDRLRPVTAFHKQRDVISCNETIIIPHLPFVAYDIDVMRST